MKMSQNQNENLCRICLRILPIQCYIFENKIKEMLESLLNKVIVLQQDSSPNICVPCFLQLKTAYKFQQDIINRERILSTSVEVCKKATLNVKPFQPKTDFKIEDELVVLCENPCLVCGKICGSYDDDLLINGHIRNHFQDVQICEHCGRKFVNIGCLRSHIKSLKNHGEFKGVYQCKQCNATFQYISFYLEHIEIACPEIFEETRKELDKELIDEKKKNNKKKKENKIRQSKPKLQPVVNKPKLNGQLCYVCQEDIPYSKYNKHIKEHKIDQLCDLCGKVLPSMKKLQFHVRTKHFKVKHKCEDCDKVFSKKYRKEAHRHKDHLNTFSHFCKSCSKGFYSQAGLTKHSHSHLQLREHVCRICDKNFSTGFALKIHMRKHTNETPFKCKICFEKFRYKVSLKTHLKSKHEVEDFTEHKCKTCGKEFGTDSGLHSHMRIHK